MAFRVGQKVVCVKSRRYGGTGAEIMPVKGNVYTVRGIDLNRPGCNCEVGLWLEEITNPPMDYRGGIEECSFDATRFRPLVEKKTETGMAILREILDRETITDKPPVRAALSTR